MKRALYIALMVYFLLALLAGIELWRGFPPRSFGEPVFKLLFLLWAVDGLLCMVLGIVLLIRHVPLLFDKDSVLAVLSGIVGLVLGLVPSCILVELFYKLLAYLDRFSPG